MLEIKIVYRVCLEWGMRVVILWCARTYFVRHWITASAFRSVRCESSSWSKTFSPVAVELLEADSSFLADWCVGINNSDEMFCQFCDIHTTESDAEAPNTKGRIHELEDGEDVIGCLKFFTLGYVVVVTNCNLLGLAVLQLYSSYDLWFAGCERNYSWSDFFVWCLVFSFFTKLESY
jgi:hypothetical protein